MEEVVFVATETSHPARTASRLNNPNVRMFIRRSCLFGEFHVVPKAGIRIIREFIADRQRPVAQFFVQDDAMETKPIVSRRIKSRQDLGREPDIKPIPFFVRGGLSLHQVRLW